jgi:3-keto-disaccharide hydrolase
MRKQISLTRLFVFTCMAIAVIACASVAFRTMTQIPEPKDEPKIIDPGNATHAPSDAIVLFDGKDLSQWSSAKNGGAPQWEIQDGAVVIKAGTGDLKTKRDFEDFQLHIEWATPAEVKGNGQERGNSGIYLQGLYEVQVLDSFNNKTYFYGQAGSVYKQYPPLVNACRKPGEWQAYDIIYHAPIFGEGDKVKKKATVTVLHNGVLIQDNVEIYGPTTHEPVFPVYKRHGKGPIVLQDHGNPTRFRNIWLREL